MQPLLSQYVTQTGSLLEQLLEQQLARWNSRVDGSWNTWCRSTWDSFTRVLGLASSVHSPAVNDGLCALYLRVVARKAAQVEELARMQSYEQVDQSASLNWLTNVGEYLSRRILTGQDLVCHRIEDVVKPNEATNHLDKLTELAKCSQQIGNTPPPDPKKRTRMRAKPVSEIDNIKVQAGRLILSFLNDGNAKTDPALDEVVLYAIGLDYEAVHPEYVYDAVANLWLTDNWRGFPDDYYKDPGITRDARHLAIKPDAIGVSILGIAKKFSTVDRAEKSGSDLYFLDELRSSVTYGGDESKLTCEQLNMLKMLLTSHDWVSMSGLGVSKPSRAFKALPLPIQGLIESVPGKGYRLRPEFRRRSAKKCPKFRRFRQQ